MRYVIILLLISIPNHLHAQDWDATCEEATEQATNDFNNGIMKATSYGLIIAEDYEFEQFYDIYLFEEYGVEASNGGCIITESTECYSATMFGLIKEKFGADFFIRSRKEAERHYKPKSKKFISNYPEVVRSGIIDLPDEMPEYPGGMTKLFNDVKAKMNIDDNSIDSVQGRTFVQFVIDKKGKASDFNILKSANPSLDSTLLDTLNEMPRWQPGKHKGKKAIVRMVLPFTY